MSAWIVDRAHIDVLVQALAEGEHVTDVHPDELGRILWRENLHAVSVRYPRDEDGEWPGPTGLKRADVEAYTYRRPGKKIELPALRVAINCYRYQCAEYEGWDQAQPQVWLQGVLDALDRAGVGDGHEHTEAWGYVEDDVHVAAGTVIR